MDNDLKKIIETADEVRQSAKIIKILLLHALNNNEDPSFILSSCERLELNSQKLFNLLDSYETRLINNSGCL